MPDDTDVTADSLVALKRWADLLKHLPKPVSYIVLDPDWSPALPHVDGEDRFGRRYVLTSPAILDEIRHHKQREHGGPIGITEMAARLAAIVVYRRQDMPGGWPDALEART